MFKPVLLTLAITITSAQSASTAISPIDLDGYRQEQLVITLHKSKTLSHTTTKEKLTIWLKQGEKYKNLKQLSASGGVEGSFGKVKVFQQQGHQLIHVPLIHHGTGHSREERFFCLAFDHSLKAVNFEPASVAYDQLTSQQSVHKGEINRFSDTAMTFEFSIWQQQDANCCPTAGKVSGNYKIVQDPGHYACDNLHIVPDQFYRSPVDNFN